MSGSAEVNPNDRQVGGSHYKSPFQHWDFVNIVLGGSYLEGCFTKYLSRWRKKGGLQDLMKSLHYLEKIEAQHVAHPIRSFLRRVLHIILLSVSNITHSCDVFSDANELTDDEAIIIKAIALWYNAQHLADIKELLWNIIFQERAADAFRNPKMLGYDTVRMGIDGDHAMALVGDDLQSGIGMFVSIAETKRRWPESEDKAVYELAMAEARFNLETRIGRELEFGSWE